MVQRQLEQKDKVLTFFGEIKDATVENTVREIARINRIDRDYLAMCRQRAIDNGQDPSQVELAPIVLVLSTGGGCCYAGLTLHDVIESSQTPVEVVCTGRVMSMGVIAALGAKVRKAYRNTTFMIHQVQGISSGTLRDMEDSVAEGSRLNEMVFGIIKAKTNIIETQLNELMRQNKDWFLTAEEALELGIVTEIV